MGTTSRSTSMEKRKMKTSSKAAITKTLIAVALGILASTAIAQGTSEGFVNAKDIQWGPAPPAIPKGAQIAVLQGDPFKAGPFVMRLKVPAGYKIPPHWHTQDESLTVISGSFYFGKGDKAQTSNAPTITAGAFHYLAGKDHHYLVAKTPSVIQINGNGPFDVTYINANEDPQAKM
ncbi:MAG TPA: cupin domain-containing protein [Casimicrobiaceae bacterium]|nr:cupin domain-containing protein [Casimicrobiaceae bacterium]